MPIYEYRCKDCQQLFEEWQKGFEERDVNCPICGGPSSRLISNSAFILKGSGWYATDYSDRKARAGNNGDGKEAQAQESSSQDSAQSTSSESSAGSQDTQSS